MSTGLVDWGVCNQCTSAWIIQQLHQGKEDSTSACGMLHSRIQQQSSVAS